MGRGLREAAGLWLGMQRGAWEGLVTTVRLQAAGGTGGGAEEAGQKGRAGRWSRALRRWDSCAPETQETRCHLQGRGAHMPPSPPSPVGICWGDACRLVGRPRCTFWSLKHITSASCAGTFALSALHPTLNNTQHGIKSQQLNAECCPATPPSQPPHFTDQGTDLEMRSCIPGGPALPVALEPGTWPWGKLCSRPSAQFSPRPPVSGVCALRMDHRRAPKL